MSGTERDYFVPGRTELAGNHTDHQQGRVLAAAIPMGHHARARRREDGIIAVESRSFAPFRVDTRSLEPVPEERGTSAALCRGVAAALKKRGGAVGGFSLTVESDLRSGAGMSSSAAFAVLVARVLNDFYNGGGIYDRALARAAQEAENLYFGKPCGLMDPMACILGGAMYMDFSTGEVASVRCDFAGMGLTLCLVDTGGRHDHLSAAYGEIKEDMCAMAARFGKTHLAQVDPAAFVAMPHVPGAHRQEARAAHFFGENARVPLMRDALLNRDGETYLRLMNQSGRSSENLLHNIRCPQGDDRLEQGLRLAASILEGRGAWRVHGGGFAGCVQAAVPVSLYEAYRAGMEGVFGQGACIRLMG